MTNQFNTPTKSKMQSNQGKSSKSFFSTNLPGKITNTIGTGKNARDSFIYLTLKWSFYSGISITILIVLNHWFFRKLDRIPDFMGDVSIAWEIVIPLITLALGYAFGKSEN